MQDSLSTPIRRNRDWLQVIQSYVQLTKPRIILLLLFTTAGSLWMAAAGQLDPKLAIITLLSGTMAAGSANTINCFYDRDIDQIMERTRSRPIPSGRVSPRDALIFATLMAVGSFSLLATFANLLSAALSMLGIFFYVVVYTHWLKRHSTQNIVIGGAAGAIPPLVGWAAVTGEIGWPAWIFFGLIFLWTPPHFWALAMMIREDYASVNVPMLPVIEGNAETTKQIMLYTLTLLPVSLLLVYPLGVMGAVYSLFAIGLGAVFVVKSWQLMQVPDDLFMAKSVFKYSIFYMLLLCVGMVIDSLPVTHTIVASVQAHVQNVVGLLV